jgi:hypothetical protein
MGFPRESYAQGDVVVVVIIAEHVSGVVGRLVEEKWNEADVSTPGDAGKRSLGKSGRSSGRVQCVDYRIDARSECEGDIPAIPRAVLVSLENQRWQGSASNVNYGAGFDLAPLNKKC